MKTGREKGKKGRTGQMAGQGDNKAEIIRMKMEEIEIEGKKKKKKKRQARRTWTRNERENLGMNERWTGGRKKQAGSPQAERKTIERNGDRLMGTNGKNRLEVANNIGRAILS